jgi:F0F1-type ATP synthase gamma subunit
MQKKSDIIEEISFLENLNKLATVYETISIMKMQQIRKGIISSRTYVNNLIDIFTSLQYVKPDAKRDKEREGLVSKQEIEKQPLATVLITANAKFHGDILRKIFDHFAEHYDRTGDLFVIGKIGREFINEYSKTIKFQEFDISDLNFTIDDLKPILFHLLKYKKIQVYYAIFKNIVEQVPFESDIADLQKLTAEEVAKAAAAKQHPDFLYEPSAYDISSFIHNNVIALLLLQTVSETHLARLASRMKAMDTLLQRVESDIKNLSQRKHRATRALQDSKQLDRLAGMTMW